MIRRTDPMILKEDPGTFQKIGQYLSRPEYKFQSKHTSAGVFYWVKLKGR